MRPRTQQLRRLEAISLYNRPLLSLSRARYVHSSSRHHAAAGAPTQDSHLLSPRQDPPKSEPSALLARLPTSSVFRTWLITRMSSSPMLLTLCFAILKRMLASKSALMDVERNPVLSKILKATFYAQFCAGETKEEVARHTEMSRSMLGYDGIILDYAAEVLEVGEGKEKFSEEVVKKEVEHWEEGLLATIDVARQGDFIGVKLSGLGSYALSLLKSNSPPTPLMNRAIYNICTAARTKNVFILIDAEEESTNPGIEAWTLSLQRQYNTPAYGRAMIYTTYQAYLQSAPRKLARDLEAARKDGFILGAKLVRGAYLEAERRRGVPVWATKEDTDKCYDAMASALLTRSYNSYVHPVSPNTSFPAADLLLATHNLASIQRVLSLRSSQALTMPPSELPRLAYGQLQGMADEISQMLVTEGERMQSVERPRVYKCMTWGSTVECLHFLLRRAEENKDAVSRTEETRRAMGRELGRRARRLVGME